MNNLTLIQKIKSFILNHKIWSIIILLIMIILTYLLFFKSKTSTETRYVTSTISKGNIIVSVSGSGQIESTDTININTKTSGDVVFVPVHVGQEVKKGDLIASIDSRDARIALETAQLSLDKMKKPNTLTVLQKENSLKKVYDDAWNNVSSFVVDSQTVIAGMEDLNNGYLGYQNKMLLSKTGKDKLDVSEKAYWEAKKSLDSTVNLYKSLSRSSSNKDIDNLVSNSLDTSKKISNAVKLYQASYDYMTNSLDDGSATISINTQKNIITWTNNVNNYSNSLLSNVNSLGENSQSLTDALSPADEFDIRQAELSLETKQNSYNDCFIRAPFDGIISTLTAKVGQSASGSIGTLIAKQKIVNISLNEVDIAKIKLDQKATMTFDAISDLTLTGKVSGIDSVGTVSSGVVSYNVSIILDVDDSRVKPGMSVSVTIITDTAQDVLVVPNSAIKTKNGVSYVDTFSVALPESISGVTGSISNILPTQTNIETGISDDTNTQIISGLKEGDIIVIKIIKGSTSTSTSTPSLLSSLMPGGNRTATKSSTIKTSTSVNAGAGAHPMD